MKTWSDMQQATYAQVLAWAGTQAWARAMADCPQDPHWHAEGDVWTHTRMVCAELERLAEWSSLDRPVQAKLLFAALLHDAGKPATTALDAETGRLRSPNHSAAGAVLARSVLRELGCDLATREEICRLVRFHGRPPYLLEKPKPEREVIWLSWLVDNQGGVIQAAREQCREHLRARSDFAFNATNVTRELRQRWIGLFTEYGARLDVVYVEPALSLILQQNRRRPAAGPEQVILRLLARLEPPTLTECHGLVLTDGTSVSS